MSPRLFALAALLAAAALAAPADAAAARRRTRLSRSPARRAEAVARAAGALARSPEDSPRARRVLGSAYEWEERWTSTFVDQFNYGANVNSTATFEQRYLYNDKSWCGPTCPVFVYLGNEGDITLFANNTGFLWEAAVEFQAAVVFIEHRYYGLSLPFGDASYAPENLGLLSIEQCLADYSSVVASLLANLSATGTAPVIGFGGSYGGMLALWGRMRYPHVYAGVIASSAPILQVPGLMDPKAYNGIITTDYRDANPTAPAVVANAFTGLLAAPAADYPALQRAMRMCNAWESIDDVYSAVYYVLNAWGFMAMADYSAPACFLGCMPAYPVNASAAALTDPSAPLPELLRQVADGPLAVFYNYTGAAGACYNDTSDDPPGLEGSGWDVQCCKEVVQPIGAYGMPNDVGPVSPFSVDGFIRSCQQQFDGLTPRPYLLQRLYGDAALAGASRMSLPSGQRDPWRSGDVVANSSATAGDVIAFVIDGAAHHADLRAADPLDTPPVLAARGVHKAAMRRWIAAFHEERRAREAAAAAAREL